MRTQLSLWKSQSSSVVILKLAKQMSYSSFDVRRDIWLTCQLSPARFARHDVANSAAARNCPGSAVRHRALTAHRSEVAASAVAFSPVRENPGRPLLFLINILFLPKTSLTH
ncbi:hypothetical protein EVAR_34620_1 [Eumeta japonica]|uniref:Uncharacterized protein n=1 Tax=Eumeta variegata TaxID=151549 RepID=A0A4C1VI48_EUMVA|nr:hypothetical protein EVAR_34620_1 [Eumeta japonica]